MEEEGKTTFYFLLFCPPSQFLTVRGNQVNFTKRSKGSIRKCFKTCDSKIKKICKYFVNPASDTKLVCSRERCSDKKRLSLRLLLCELVCSAQAGRESVSQIRERYGPVIELQCAIVA